MSTVLIADLALKVSEMQPTEVIRKLYAVLLDSEIHFFFEVQNVSIFEVQMKSIFMDSEIQFFRQMHENGHC